MIVRFVSLVSLICAIAIASVNVQNSSDPLFFIVAGGALADTIRILLTGLMVVGAYVKIPKTFRPEIFLSVIGVSLVAIGLCGFVMNSFDYIFYNYIRPLDFLLLAEVGIISNLVALEANKPMMHFSDPYRRAFTIAVLPKLKKIKAAAA
jgi:hypothetical protein